MTKQVQRRRGTATQHTSFTGAEGELSVNTTNKSVHVHDNVTAGGFEAARVDMDNVTSSSILTAAGITATTTELNYVDGVTSAIQTQIDGKAGTASPTFTGTLTAANLTATGTTTLAGASTSADITFGDNDKAIFGAGSDLSIFHNGSSSLIEDSGTGGLTIRSNLLTVQNAAGNETVAQFVEDGFVKLFHNNSQVFTTTSTGIDVTGTVTADGLTVDGNIALRNADNITFKDTSNNNRGILTFDANNDIVIGPAGAGIQDIKLKNNGAKTRLNIDVGGDISFYEDTGTTAKFFWDASAESLGIGTSSPSSNLHVIGNTADVFRIERDATNDWRFQLTTGALAIRDATSDTERMRIDSSGNVGIGTSSPASLIHANNTSGDATIRITSSDTGYAQLFLGDQTSGSQGRLEYFNNNNSMGFYTSGTERMRIDSSGNLLVGKTSSTFNNTAGIGQFPSGRIYVTRDGGNCLYLNRVTSDGDIAAFYKDGTKAGSIGVAQSGDRTYFSGGSYGIASDTSDATIMPCNTTGGGNNGVVSLGKSDARFKDLYLSGGVYLGGTGAANKLDDYEEGTFTPTLVGTGTAGVRSGNSVSRGKYTKVGNLVHFQLYIDANSWSTAPTGSIRIRDLPFSSSSTDGSETTGSVMHNAYNFSYTTLVYFIASGVNEIRLYSLGDNVNWLQAPISNEAMNFYITGAYTTT